MAVREYVGARYVPVFADPIDWDSTKTYEPLTIVYHQGNSYTSRQYIPSGIDITNNTYWAHTGNFNAQIDAYRDEVDTYRDEVQTFDGRITDNSDAITALNSEISAIKANNWVTTNRLANNSVTKDKLQKDIFLIFGDSWCDFTNNPDWATPVANFVNCEVKNYGVGGAGFSSPANNLISTQVTNAINRLSADEKIRVKFIVVMGGVNDHQPKAPSTFYSAIQAVIQTCILNFPNALVQFFHNSNALGYSSAQFGFEKMAYCIRDFWTFASKYTADSTTAMNAKRFCYAGCGPAFWICNSNEHTAFFKDDLLHLNNYGRNAVAQAIMQGFGLLNIEWSYLRAFKPSNDEYQVFTRITPTKIENYGSIKKSEKNEFIYGTIIGARIIAASAAMRYDTNGSPTDDLISLQDALKLWTNGSGTDFGYSRIIIFDYNNAKIEFSSMSDNTVYYS